MNGEKIKLYSLYENIRPLNQESFNKIISITHSQAKHLA